MLQLPSYPPVSDETKKLLTRMLIYEDGNRIGWEEIFANRIVQEQFLSRYLPPITNKNGAENDTFRQSVIRNAR
jgi:hypothetical protein